MFCENCGAKLDEGAVFCGNCGRKVDAAPAEASSAAANTPETIYSVPSGNTNNAEADNPGSTGRIYQPSSPGRSVQPAKNNGVLIGVISAVVAIAVVLGIFYFTGAISFGSGSKDVSEVVEFDTDELSGIEQKKDESIVINTIEPGTITSIVNSETSYTDFGVYVHNLSNGYEFGYNMDQTFLASAMCQVVILETLSQVVDKYNINPANEYVYFNYMANGKEAPTSKSENGSQVSLKKIVEDVAVYGDNNKSNLVVDYLGDISGMSNGFDVINDMLRSKGYNSTRINRKTYVQTAYIDTTASPNTTTPREIGKLFETLIFSSSFGSEAYMKNIFKSVSSDGQPIGIKKYVPAYYDVCNVNALNSQNTNNVAIISDGETEVVVAVLSCTDENFTKYETNTQREKAQDRIVDYIVSTQFR